MWKEYSKGYLKQNRAAGVSVMAAALLSASCGDDSDNVLPVPPEEHIPAAQVRAAIDGRTGGVFD